MFKQFYGMKFNPFSKELDIENSFESHDLLEVNSRFEYIKSIRGIFVLIGEPGTGKSTALRNFVKGLNPGLYKSCYFTLATVSVADFYRGLLTELGEIPSSRKVTMFKQIQNTINSLYYNQKITPVIILDEVHMLSNSILEELRLLFSFNMDSENPYILILSGQTQLKSKLNLSINVPLKQRITVKHTMLGLKKDEVYEYLNSRMKLSGVTTTIFSKESSEAIALVSKGFPRMINKVTTATLMYAYSMKKEVIDEDCVYQGYKECEL
jgi:type II secretory pathway predicted ATPase ExeA